MNLLRSTSSPSDQRIIKPTTQVTDFKSQRGFRRLDSLAMALLTRQISRIPKYSTVFKPRLESKLSNPRSRTSESNGSPWATFEKGKLKRVNIGPGYILLTLHNLRRSSPTRFWLVNQLMNWNGLESSTDLGITDSSIHRHIWESYSHWLRLATYCLQLRFHRRHNKKKSINISSDF